MSLRSFITIVLCFVIVFLAIENYKTWNRPYKPLPDMVVVPEKSETKKENQPMPASTKEPASTKSQNLVSEKNIFSPERKDFPIPAAAARPVVRPQIILYGVTIAEDYQAASVANPGRSLRKGERETLTLKSGEKIGEYSLTKVLPDRIVMASNGGDAFEVLLYDPRSPKRRMEVRTETKPAMIASAQPAQVPPSGEAQMQAQVAAPSQEPVEQSKKPIQAQVQVLPYNKHTYQLLGPSAVVARGMIFIPPSGQPPVKN